MYTLLWNWNNIAMTSFVGRINKLNERIASADENVSNRSEKIVRVKDSYVI